MMKTQPLIELKNYMVKKGEFSLKPCSFSVYANEVLAVIGRTGAGKTVLMEGIAGFHDKYEGELYYKGKNKLSSSIENLNIGFVYQDFLLFPHMTVYDNIAYGLKIKKIKKSIIDRKVREKAKLFGLAQQLTQYPGTLSGGEKQRTALARAMIMEPEILILDEPFSALDPKTKKDMYQILQKIKENMNCTILFVTHDFEEVKYLANRVAIVLDGELMGIRQVENLFYDWQDPRINLFLELEEKNENRNIVYKA